jgi:hypothetical protein
MGVSCFVSAVEFCLIRQSHRLLVHGGGDPEAFARRLFQPGPVEDGEFAAGNSKRDGSDSD